MSEVNSHSNSNRQTTNVNENRDFDWFLRALVNLANYAGLGFGITLNVGGNIISGKLVSGAAFFEGFGGEFLQMLEGKDAAGLASSIKNMFGEIDKAQKEQAAKLGEGMPTPAYIHLQDAKIFSPGAKPIPGNRGVWWRGKLSSVDGFSLGSLSAD